MSTINGSSDFHCSLANVSEKQMANHAIKKTLDPRLKALGRRIGGRDICVDTYTQVGDGVI